MASIPTGIPAAMRAGDTWQWYTTSADYPASSGWALAWTFTAPALTSNKLRFDGTSGSVNTRGQSKLTASGVADGDQWLTTIAAGTSAGQSGTFAAGRWSYVGKVSKAGEVYTVAAGTFDVLPDLSAQDANTDTRSTARLIVEQIDAAVAALSNSTNPIQSYTILGRAFTYRNVADLLALRKTYAALARRDEGKGMQVLEVVL